jgi:anti-anti-sigma regulatory factor
MHEERQGSEIDDSAVHTAPRRGPDTVSRSAPASLELGRSRPYRGDLTNRDDTMTETRQPLVEGQLTVRWERRHATWIMWLSGTLDRATATLLDRELDARAIGLMRLIVDLTGLEFIDSPGRDALVRIHRRSTMRGQRPSFRHGPHVAQPPAELTRTVRLRSRGATRTTGVSGDEDPYFALAMACADVDHPPSGDRPQAA